MKFEHPLPRSAKIVDRENFLLNKCSGKHVLHLGCVDAGLFDEKLGQGSLLHAKLGRVASYLVGVDSDAQGIRRLQELGIGDMNFMWNVEQLDLLTLESPVDVILAGEIIEHINNPGLFLQGTKRLIERTGADLILTAPNAFGFSYLWRILRKKELVHPDHNFYFSYTTLSTLLKKCGYEVVEFYYYSNPSIRAWEWIQSLTKRYYKLGRAQTGNTHTVQVSADFCFAGSELSKRSLPQRLYKAIAWLAYLLFKDAVLRLNPALAHGLIFVCRISPER